MINLQVEKYCEHCPEFEVKQETLNFVYGDCTHYLTCEHADKCRNLYQHFGKEKLK